MALIRSSSFGSTLTLKAIFLSFDDLALVLTVVCTGLPVLTLFVLLVVLADLVTFVDFVVFFVVAIFSPITSV